MSAGEQYQSTTVTHGLPPGSVVITPNQMFDEMRAIHDEVRNLAGKVDPALAEMRGDIGELKSDRKALELRIRALENWRWFVLGISSVAALVASAGVSWIIDVVRR